MRPQTAVLLDLDALGGGIDISLGAETVPGARWSGLHATGARLDPEQLLDGLPRWRSVPFLACDGHEAPAPQAVRSVLRSAREIGPVVVDVGRSSTPARTSALAQLTAIVLVVPAEIRGVTAAAAMQAALRADGFDGELRVVVRTDGAVLGARRIAHVLDLTLAGSVRGDRGLAAARDRGIDPRRTRHSTRELAHELLAWACAAPEPPARREPGQAVEADLGRADLGRADLGRADLDRADLGRADLGPADLGRADLGRANLGAGAMA